MKPLPVNFDSIFESLGGIGKYHVIKFVLFIGFPVILCSFHANNYIFAAQDVTYRCRIPDCEGNSSDYNQAWLPNAIPDSSKCERYSLNESYTDEYPIETCPATYFDKSSNWGCDDGYVFKEQDSLIEELDIPCESWKRTLIGTLHSVGTLLVLPLIGTFSDRLGRRHALIVSSILEGVFGFIKGLSVSYAMFATFELLEPTFGSGVYSSAYILIIEFLPFDSRAKGGCLCNMFFGIGQVIMGVIAMYVPYWRHLIYILYAPSILVIAYYWILDESPRWLVTNFRFQEAKDVLLNVAKMNGRSLTPKIIENLEYNIQNEEQIKTFDKKEAEAGEEVRLSPWKEVMKSSILIFRVCKVSVWWITCTFCFYGISINSAVLPGNKYINFIISASTEVPAHVMVYFGMQYVGRKWTLFACFLTAGISLLVFPFIPTETLLWLGLMCYFIGKLFITAAFNGIYLYTSELFPTPLRHSLLATCSMVGRIGSILAPQTPLLGEVLPELPAYLFSSLCLLSALLMLNAPETLGRPLPETVEEAENITASKRNILSEDRA